MDPVLIWKARNDKVFNDKEMSPLDTFQLAMAEAEAWKTAQLLSNEPEDFEPVDDTCRRLANVIFPRCQVDALWTYNSKFFGEGFMLDVDDE